jgi:hypothetical protein
MHVCPYTREMLMARKKERKVKAVYTVFEYEDKGPMEVILPDGRLALLIPSQDLYLCESATVMNGCVRRLRGGKIEILDDTSDTLEQARESLKFSYDDGEVNKMALEIRPVVSFN